MTGDDLTLLDWLDERYKNARRIACTKRGSDRDGWIEDASYFQRAKLAVAALVDASGDNHANSPLRMHIALRLLRAWHNGTAGYDSSVVMTVNQWIDGDMKGPIPWPESAFFAAWARDNGYAKVGPYIGFTLIFEDNVAQAIGNGVR